jgi:hypothetical protein
LASPTTIAPPDSLVRAESGWLVARASGDVEVYTSPDHPAPNRVLAETTLLGSRRVFLVEEGPVDGWVKLSLPVRPNGASGWARSDAFDFATVTHRIAVDLSDYRLVVYEADQPVIETVIAIGSVHNPTPMGRFFVTDIVELDDPSGPWGPMAIGLSAHSETITEFNGGDGIVGIHGTNRPATIGQPASLGCIRVPNDVISAVGRLIALGAPVEIGP